MSTQQTSGIMAITLLVDRSWILRSQYHHHHTLHWSLSFLASSLSLCVGHHIRSMRVLDRSYRSMTTSSSYTPPKLAYASCWIQTFHRRNITMISKIVINMMLIPPNNPQDSIYNQRPSSWDQLVFWPHREMRNVQTSLFLIWLPVEYIGGVSFKYLILRRVLPTEASLHGTSTLESLWTILLDLKSKRKEKGTQHIPVNTMKEG